MTELGLQLSDLFGDKSDGLLVIAIDCDKGITEVNLTIYNLVLNPYKP